MERTERADFIAEVVMDEGLTLFEAAKRFDTTVEAIRGVLARRGLGGKQVREPKLTDHRRIVQDMKPLDAVEYLLGVIEEYVPEKYTPEPEVPFEGGGPSVRRSFRFMLKHEGKDVTKKALYDALYWDILTTREMPQPKIVDVWICKLRAKLKGTEYSIKTIHGEGFRLERVPHGKA
jgi:hypothetical protein